MRLLGCASRRYLTALSRCLVPYNAQVSRAGLAFLGYAEAAELEECDDGDELGVLGQKGGKGVRRRMCGSTRRVGRFPMRQFRVRFDSPALAPHPETTTSSRCCPRAERANVIHSRGRRACRMWMGIR